MKTTFGPWTTSLGSSVQLSTFWKRRMAMLPVLHKTKLKLSRREFLSALSAGCGLIAVPLVRTQEPDAEAPQPRKTGRIFFTQQTRLGSIQPDGTGLTWLAKPFEIEERTGPPFSHRISPDGQRVAYSMIKVPAIEAQVMVFVRGLAEPEPGEYLGVDGTYACWSPDGQQLVVTDPWTTRDDKKAVHWRVEVQTKNVAGLILPPGHVVVDWDPEGKRLLALNNDGDGTTLVLIDPEDGTTIRSLTPAVTPHIRYARFSPDGQRILFEKAGENVAGQLFVHDLRQAASKQMTRELNAKIDGFCWSPDGRQIAYAWRPFDPNGPEEQDAECFLEVMDAEGLNSTALLTERGRRLHEPALHVCDWR